MTFDPWILMILKTLLPAITARWPSGDRARQAIGAPAEYMVFWDALGRERGGGSVGFELSAGAGWPSSFLKIFPLFIVANQGGILSMYIYVGS